MSLGNCLRACRVATVAAAIGVSGAALACCPAPPSGKPVVNADQTVILLWDPATNTEHFVRKASFKSEANDFGFLVPSPSPPELAESGNAAFPLLQKLTEPEIVRQARPSGGLGCGCSMEKGASLAQIHVLAEKEVAGFHAVVLEAKSSDALVNWLKDNGYAFSPEIAAWAKPYIDEGWKITALKVAKNKGDGQNKTVAAAALRISFRTDRPLFPYREPDYKGAAKALGGTDRLLRIYFISDARYEGALTREVPWTGRVAWAGKLTASDRKQLLELLKLPESSGPSQWWLTEFEDHWPYRLAPADVFFSTSKNQDPIRRPPVIQYVSRFLPDDLTFYAIAAVLLFPPLYLRAKRRRRRKNNVTSSGR